LLFLDPGSEIRDPGSGMGKNQDPGSGINIPDPQHCFIPPRDIKLPPFWRSRPAAWFVFVESRFRLRNIVDETAKFDHVLSALPEDMVGQILDLVEAAPAATPYTFLQRRTPSPITRSGICFRRRSRWVAANLPSFWWT
jgi:hypothetical protein